MTDEELEHTLQRSYQMAQHATDVYCASILLEETRESYAFDRIVLGVGTSVEEEAFNLYEEAVEENEKGIKEAERRNLDLSEYFFDENESIEDSIETLSEIRDDRVGLSGIARDL